MKGIIASLAGMTLIACAGCGGGGGSGVDSKTSAQATQVSNSPCFISDPTASPACIVDGKVLARSIVQYGDDSRLKAVLAKAQSGQPIVIGAIGGSITQGAWATTAQNTYVGRVFGWWQASFPQSQVTLINAGIGKTNSKYGNQRVQRDLLQYNPDFVIIEFANNDAPTPDFQESYRQLAQTIMNAPSHPAVIMLFTMARDGSNSEDNQIPIGKELNLPMVALREAVYPEEQSGQLNPIDITADEIHPNDLGHQIIAQIVAYRILSAQHSTN